jgi:hypothetical protein
LANITLVLARLQTKFQIWFEGDCAMRKLIAAVAVSMVASMTQAQTYKGYEHPPYKVEVADGDMELRQYGSHRVAEVTVDGNRDAAIGAGFRVLAGYIFGSNADGEKIAMTVPVAQTSKGDGQWTVRFMVPAGNTADTMPKPKDSRIRFIQVPPERQIALQFSGLRGDATMATKSDELRAWARARGLTITAGPHFYFYDGPMTLPWNRRNEVAFSVK